MHWPLYPTETDPSTHWIGGWVGPGGLSGHSGDKTPSLLLPGNEPQSYNL